MAKRILAACIERVIEFDSQKEAATYLEGLRERKKTFVVARLGEVGNKFQIRIKEQYNNNPMIED